jgi:glucokinase
MEKKYIIAIDLGGTNLKLALVDLKYKIRDKLVLSTQRFSKKESLILAISSSVKKLIENNCLTRSNILGVGLGLPGPIDVYKGIVHFFPNIPGWKEVNLRHILKRRLRLPVFLDNDANLMSLAEYKFGAAKGSRYALCITLGTGVGGGIIIEGNIYRGADNATGEIGHLPINEKGPRCNCGGRGCLETYIGNNSIKNKAKKLFKRNISLEELSTLAKKKNKQALAIWSDVAAKLGIALVGLTNLFNPDCIVIGGGVANAGRILFDKVKEVVKRQAMTVQGRHVKILKAKLGNDAGLIGAAIFVKEKLRQ